MLYEVITVGVQHIKTAVFGNGGCDEGFDVGFGAGVHFNGERGSARITSTGGGPASGKKRLKDAAPCATSTSRPSAAA